MAGIYIHIPFCKKACHYCNFHFSTSMKLKDKLLLALHKEIRLQKDYLGAEKIKTIYFGGGTPSLLTRDEIAQLLAALDQQFEVDKKVEITLEANPDDLSPNHLSALKQAGINRLSIGVQSFYEEDLRFMNRAHNADQAKQCIEYAQKIGFENITIDLIYGTPDMNHERWRNNINFFLNYKIPHLSAYCLTVEPNTALAHFVQNGKAKAVDEVQSAEQFEILLEMLTQNGYQQYEISNFSLPNWESKHNSNYWRGVSYLGLGPAAHSFNGHSRQWNIANNSQYIKAIQAGTIPAEVEVLTPSQRYNEYLLTTLRTMWGCDLNKVLREFGEDQHAALLNDAKKYIETTAVVIQGEHLALSPKGRLIADQIISDLFV